MQSIPVITIDGPSGTGKGTIAHLLAAELGWHVLDSGAHYRIIGLEAEQRGIPIGDSAALCRLANAVEIQFGTRFRGSICVDGIEKSTDLRTEAAGALASKVAASPALRHALLARQHAFRQPPGLVADGRDMGTVVFPDAGCKIFLTASAEVRAQRRYNQLKDKDVGVSLPSLFRDIQERDERDSTRAVSPLKPARDALLIDTGPLSVLQVLTAVRTHVARTLAVESSATPPASQP
jgi:cytidylate kinase